MDGRWVEVVWGVEVSNAADDTMVKLQDFGCRVEASNVEREIISEFCVLAPKNVSNIIFFWISPEPRI